MMTLLRPLALIPVLLLLGPASAIADVRDDPGAEIPFIRSVEPTSAKPGETVVASGVALDKAHLSELFLTDGQKDYKVEIVSQSGAELKFKVPVSTPAGRLCLMVLTAKTGLLIEQPTYLTVK